MIYIVIKITFIQTGGTIDKDYPQYLSDHGYAFKIQEPAVLDTLERIKPMFEIEMVRHMQKDSLDITEEDKQGILQVVEENKNNKIIITHGTDTIGLTAEVLSVVKNKTIVLTGAMMPEKFREYDADFNVGMAVGAVQKLPAGVYVALHGELKTGQEFLG